MDIQTMGIAAGTTLAAGELICLLATTLYRDQIAARWPRVASHMAIGVKTTSYRFCAGVDTFVLTFVMTGNPWAGAGVVGGEIVTKFVLFYAHEYVWQRPFLQSLIRES